MHSQVYALEPILAFQLAENYRLAKYCVVSSSIEVLWSCEMVVVLRSFGSK